MTIRKLITDEQDLYAVCNESKKGTAEEIAVFYSLETATNVLRYIRGDIQTREQMADAIQAIRIIDGKGCAEWDT